MFTHLHLHTEYSLLDATTRIPALIEKLQANNMAACAITDHGNMYGAFKFRNAMIEAGLKPIVGCEIYVAPRSMEQKEFGIDNKYFHLILLAKNLNGYKNLMKIVSIAHMEGFYYRPRIDFETLSKYTQDLVATSACLAGPLCRPLLNGDYNSALETAKKYAEIFKDNFYVEIQRNGMVEQEQANEGLIKIAKELNLPLVATCDAHYLNKEDAAIQEILWCISDGTTIDDPKRRTMPTNEFYVKTSDEMNELFKDIPEAIENTQKIADMIETYEMSFGRIEPHYLDLPEGLNAGEYLKQLTFEGAKEKYGEMTKELEARLNYELDVIGGKGYNDYFLVVRDYVKFCRDNGIVVSMRGSGCGSAVAYSIDITNIEPIGWELYFERFLNPERESPPDFDIDIADKRRDELIQYTINKYGIDNVKQIGTFSKLQTRQAIKDVGRVLGVDLAITDKLAKMVEIVFGKAKPIDYMIEHNKEFAEIINSSEKTQKLRDIVRQVSGICRGTSTHACGIIVAPQPVVNFCPIQRDSHGGGIGMTQYEMADAEATGLMKFDFLGLRNLNVIGEAVKKIEVNRGVKLNLRKLDRHDEDSFKIMQEGHTVGIFQMESEGMKRVVKQVYPESLEDVCYILAAYRPGPMQFISEYVAVKRGEKQAEYIFPELESILGVTNGVITYQEHIMSIVRTIGGYTLGNAAALMKLMSKKKYDKVEHEKPIFMEGAMKKGYPEDKLNELWDKLLLFANYGFNKAHSASYATVSYWTAYLKAHYPLEFMAALLEGDLDNFDRVIIDLGECERLGIEVLPPTLNESGYYFTVEGDHGIRFGLGGIKNVGNDIVKGIVEERKANGNFKHLDDFVHRMHESVAKRAIEYLIMAGTMDAFGDRNALLQILPGIYEKEKARSKTQVIGQIDIFSLTQDPNNKKEEVVAMTPLPNIEKTPVSQALVWEKELLGLYFSSHPLDPFQDFFETKHVIPIKQALDNGKNNDLIILGAMVNKVRKIATRKGDNMAFITIEDKSGASDAIIFPRTYQELKDTLVENKPILIAGRINVKDGDKSIIVEKAKYIDEAKCSSKFDGIIFRIRPIHTEAEVAELKQFIANSTGDVPVKIVVDDGEHKKTVLLNKTIAMNDETKKWLRKF